MQETLNTRTRNRTFRTSSCYLEVELIHLRDKSRYVTAPQPDQYIVQITSKSDTSRFQVVLRSWHYDTEIPHSTLSQSNAANYRSAKQQYDELKWKLGGAPAPKHLIAREA